MAEAVAGVDVNRTASRLAGTPDTEDDRESFLYQLNRLRFLIAYGLGDVAYALTFFLQEFLMNRFPLKGLQQLNPKGAYLSHDRPGLDHRIRSFSVHQILGKSAAVYHKFRLKGGYPQGLVIFDRPIQVPDRYSNVTQLPVVFHNTLRSMLQR
jgi:hypothetical protein